LTSGAPLLGPRPGPKVTVDEQLQRALRMIAHLDRVLHPEAKEQINKITVLLNDAIAAQRGRKRLEAERRTKAEAERDKRREAAARRKAAKS
jgi:hypothetical protein